MEQNILTDCIFTIQQKSVAVLLRALGSSVVLGVCGVSGCVVSDKAGKAAMLGLQNLARRTLADISNLQQKPKQLIRDEKRQSIQITTKEYVEKLQKENMALMKMLIQRNKIIEQIGIELHRLPENRTTN